jgi:DNA mismatch repair protein MSH6
VILDELGRGTSTFDGTAIAHAVVHHLSSVVKCRCLFATHYHSLVEEWGSADRHPLLATTTATAAAEEEEAFSSSSSSSSGTKKKLKPLVALGHMACIVENGDDDDDEEEEDTASSSNSSSSSSASSSRATTKTITFLYNLTAGSSPKSFGINVAKLARLPEAVLKLAAAKSHAFEASLTSKSSEFNEAVDIGRRLLAAVVKVGPTTITTTDNDAGAAGGGGTGCGGGVNDEEVDVEAAGALVLEAWQAAQHLC